MQINLDSNLARYSIYAYGPGEVTVMQPQDPEAELPPEAIPERETLTRSLIITPEQLIRDWAPQRFEDLLGEHFAFFLDTPQPPEVVLFGSGATLRWPQAGIAESLAARGIGLEVMDTGAACRTYNFLMADGRRVAAALLMI